MARAEFLFLLPLIAAGGYTILLVLLFLRRSQQEMALRWMQAFLGASIVWSFLLSLASFGGLPANLPVKALLVGTTFLGMATAVFVNWLWHRQFLVLAGVAIVANLLVDFFVPNQIFRPLPTSTWAAFTVSSVISFLTWFALGSVILLRTWIDYRRTAFPWHANRLLFWAVALLTVLTGEAMLFFRFSGLSVAGQVVRYLGVVGLVYAISSYRVFDVRTRLRAGIAYLIAALLTALPLTALFLFIQQLTPDPFVAAFTGTAVVVVVAFLLYQPLYSRVENFAYRYLFGARFNPNQITLDYSRAVSQALDVNRLAEVICASLSEKFGPNRGALLLLQQQENSLELSPIPGLGDVPRDPITVPQDHPLLAMLQQEPQPLLQYELDFNPGYRVYADDPLSHWLKRLAMEAYVPVIDGDQLAALVAIGPKLTGIPYRSGELSQMQVLANQTAVALHNARLYTEQEMRNRQIKALNRDLQKQNEIFAIMDKVKSDFITIASHELRTPLTQVKGYADILQAMNESNSLSQGQTREIAGHINRATLRLEGVITAMLDASQIDAAKMSLSYMETKLETVLRLAGEPVYPALRDRQISLTINGVVELPPLQADFKRLVQAFTNLLGNAVKYTPDQGSIYVNGRFLPGYNEKGDYLEIVIADTGIGIDPRYHEMIFQKFFRVGDPQLHSTGTTKFKGAGPGLGLTIAKGVIEAHHGRIWVESDGENEALCPGSRFYILLPLQPPPKQKGEDGKESDMETNAAVNGGPS